MNIEKITYQLFFVTAILAILTSVFTRESLVYFKPPVLLILSFLYSIKAKRINALVLITMLLIMVSEILTVKDFKGYFRIINILLSLHYCLNLILLWKSILKVKVQFKKIFTIQLLIAMALIVYVVYSVGDLILPSVYGDQLFLNVLMVCFIVFIGFCFYIYLNSKTIVSYSLMVAASCFLIVNIITGLNKLYISLEIFVVISCIVQICGQFFLIKFFIEQENLKANSEEYF